MVGIMRRATEHSVSRAAKIAARPCRPRSGPGRPDARGLHARATARPGRHGQRLARRAAATAVTRARSRSSCSTSRLIGRSGGERFTREGSILARLAHPHIARLLDAGVDRRGQPYLVLEYVDGEPIDRYCDSATLDVDARLRLFLEVLARGRARARQPRSSIATSSRRTSSSTDDGERQAARLRHRQAARGRTRRGRGDRAHARRRPRLHAGVRRARAARSAAPVTTATDVYALGVLLYVLLGGQHPRRRDQRDRLPSSSSRSSTRRRRGCRSGRLDAPRCRRRRSPTTPPQRAATPEKLRRLLRGDLDNIVAKALKKSPAERYATVDAFADDMRRYLAHEPVSARADSLAYRIAKFARRIAAPSLRAR